MKKITLLILFLFLTACQPETEKENNSSAKTSEAATQEAAQTHQQDEHAGHDHQATSDFSLVPKQPYETLETDEACSEPEVMEFFAYQCPHCYKLEPFTEKWKSGAGKDIKFVSVPTHLGHKEFGPFLIVHQTAVGLGMLDKVTPKLFERIHKYKKGFASQADAVNFLVSAGADEAEALKEIQSGEKIKAAMEENFKLLAQYKITGVPTIVVNKKYMLNITSAGGNDKVFDLVEEVLKLPSNCSK